jgi:hypothetical protein
MGSWWTPAHDEAAKHIAKKIKEAQERKDQGAERAAWREYDELHGVKFFLVLSDAAGNMVADPIMLFTDRDADAYLGQAGQGDPAAARATLHPHEQPEQTIRSWRWDAGTRSWARP